MITMMKRSAKLALALILAHILAVAQALEVEQVSGKVEVLQGTWQAPQLEVPLTIPLRTGAGRASLKMGDGKVLVASQTLLQVINTEVSLQNGQIYLEGPLTAFVAKHHIRLEADSSARMDFVAGGQRVVLLTGKGNIYNADSKKNIPLEPNKSLNILNFTLSDFLERDPWYKEKWVGLGAAKLAAFKGTVEIQSSTDWKTMFKNQPLETEGQVRTGKASWAEFDFADGSYFRLGAQALLRVLGIEKLEGGKRRFVMLLERGSAWNVVAKDKGGYEMRTSTLVAGVRGTVFRFDESGLVKVIEGQVATVSPSGEAPINQGQQLEKGQVALLKLDASDKTNLERDAQKNAPLQVQLNWPNAGVRKSLEFNLIANSDAQVTVSLNGQNANDPFQIIGNKGTFKVRPDALEGKLEVKVMVTKGSEKQEFVREYQIDHTKPILKDLKVVSIDGERHISATLEDQSNVTLNWRYLSRSEYTSLELKAGAFSVALPERKGKIVLQLKDAANNLATFFVDVQP